MITLHRFDQALPICEKALKVRPNSIAAKINFACIQISKYQIDQAFSTIDEILELLTREPSASLTSVALQMRAVVLSQSDRCQDALKDLEQAELLDPDDTLFINRAYYYFRLGELGQTAQSLDHIENQNLSIRNRAYLLSNRSRILWYMSEHATALETAFKAVSTHGDLPAVLATYGWLLGQSDRYAEALEQLNRALSIDHYFPEGNWFRHQIYEKLGDLENSAKDKKIAEDFGYIPYM